MRAVTGALLLGAVVGVVGLPACLLPNPDHCIHKAPDANAWCASVYDDRPYCSPCAAENNGCVAEEPTETSCPSYTAPPLDTGTDTDTGEDETGTDTGTETDTDTDSDTDGDTDTGTDGDTDTGTDTETTG